MIPFNKIILKVVSLKVYLHMSCCIFWFTRLHAYTLHFIHLQLQVLDFYFPILVYWHRDQQPFKTVLDFFLKSEGNVSNRNSSKSEQCCWTKREDSVSCPAGINMPLCEAATLPLAALRVWELLPVLLSATYCPQPP